MPHSSIPKPRRSTRARRSRPSASAFARAASCRPRGRCQADRTGAVHLEGRAATTGRRADPPSAGTGAAAGGTTRGSWHRRMTANGSLVRHNSRKCCLPRIMYLCIFIIWPKDTTEAGNARIQIVSAAGFLDGQGFTAPPNSLPGPWLHPFFGERADDHRSLDFSPLAAYQAVGLDGPCLSGRVSYAV